MREKEREKNINVWLPLAHLTPGNLAQNPGMMPQLGIELALVLGPALNPLSHTSQGAMIYFLKTERSFVVPS